MEHYEHVLDHIYWFALLSWLVSSRLKNKFEKYSKIPMPNGMTGKDVAEKMLRDNGIYDVKVISTPGHLTDHYNPANQTVNLANLYIIVIVSLPPL